MPPDLGESLSFSFQRCNDAASTTIPTCFHSNNKKWDDGERVCRALKWEKRVK